MRAARFLIIGTVLALAASATATPIRVGIFKGVGTGRYWHTSSHPGSAAIAALLANPAGAGMHQPIIPPQGYTVTIYGTDTSCSVAGCHPGAERVTAFIAALDTLDVAVLINNTELGAVISNAAHRQRLGDFWMTKGIVSIHATSDNGGTWAAWDTTNGARFQNHPSGDRYATLRLDTVGGMRDDPAWRFLNRGLPDTARFMDEWFSFTTNASAIRSKAFLKVAVNIDENSYEGGMGGAKVMGEDHPMSWFRQFPQGGRFFYTAISHRAATFDTVPFFRRQLYNAILWASGYDVATAIQTRGTEVSGGMFGEFARVNLSGGTLTVSLLHNGAHTVEILALDGRRIDSRRGAARGDHVFEGLRAGTVHIVAVTTPEGRSTRLVAVK